MAAWSGEVLAPVSLFSVVRPVSFIFRYIVAVGRVPNVDTTVGGVLCVVNIFLVPPTAVGVNKSAVSGRVVVT